MYVFEKFTGPKCTSFEEYMKTFKVNVPEHFNFGYDVVDEVAQKNPDKIALVWTNNKGDEKNFTFGDMAALSNKAANYLLSIGIKKGDRVMLTLKRHYSFWYTMIALCKIGAIVIPATHLLTKKDIIYRANAADIKMMICVAESECCEHIEAAQEECAALKLKAIVGKRDGWLNYQAGVKAASDVLNLSDEQKPRNNDIMILYFTSGTSGMPKMVAHSFTYPLGHIPTAVYWHNCDPNGLHFTVADTGWGKAVWGKLYGQWLTETAVFVYDHDKFIPDEMLKMMEKHKITSFCAPPTIYRYFIKEDLTKYDLSSIKYVTTAGEPLNSEVFNKFLSTMGLNIMEGFGQTETALTIANFIGSRPKPGSMGKPSPLYDIDIVNDNNEPCSLGESGEIIIRTDKGVPPGMFIGYYRDEEMTKSAWHDNIYHTGDVAWKDEDGYYWYVSRKDDVIKSSGYRIGPFEVESALMEHPAVLEAAITGVPHPDRGQIIKATIVLARGYEPSEELKVELQNHVKKVTAPYKYPRVIEFIDELPKTISGKVRRVEIREKN